MIKIVEPHEEDIIAIDGNTIEPSLSTVLDTDPSFTLTGKVVNLVIKDYYQTSTLYTLSSSGTSPAITISGATFTVDFSSVAVGKYTYYIDVVDGGETETIMTGKLYKVVRSQSGTFR